MKTEDGRMSCNSCTSPGCA